MIIRLPQPTVFIVRKNPDNDEKEWLVINEYDKADLTVVGGCVYDMELISEAEVRECEEEVGSKLKEKNLRLIRVSNIKIKAQNKNFIDFLFYVEVDFETAVSIDQKVVMNYKWVPL